MTQLLGSFGHVGSTSNVGILPALEPCAAAAPMTILGLMPAAMTTAPKAKPASHFFFAIDFLLGPAARVEQDFAPLYTDAVRDGQPSLPDWLSAGDHAQARRTSPARATLRWPGAPLIPVSPHLGCERECVS